MELARYHIFPNSHKPNSKIIEPLLFNVSAPSSPSMRLKLRPFETDFEIKIDIFEFMPIFYILNTDQKWIKAFSFKPELKSPLNVPPPKALQFLPPAALLALSFWIRGRAKLFVLFSAFSALIFRGELVLLFGPCLLVVLAQRQLSIGKTLSLSVGAAVFAISEFPGFCCLALLVRSNFLKWAMNYLFKISYKISHFDKTPLKDFPFWVLACSVAAVFTIYKKAIERFLIGDLFLNCIVHVLIPPPG